MSVTKIYPTSNWLYMAYISMKNSMEVHGKFKYIYEINVQR